MKVLYFLMIALLCSGCSRQTDLQEAGIPETTTVIQQTIQTPAKEIPEEEPPMETQSLLLSNPKDSDLVRVRDYIPDAAEELIYSTPDNFTGSVIYNFQDVYLRYGSVKKLMAVQEELRSMGLGIKIWDGFRPVSAQFKLWEICPDDTYVANPNVGYSNHSRGFAVDLTLVDLSGQELEMPTEFDDFSGKADRNYADVSETGKRNSDLLESVMEKHGFQGYYGEWWHYNDATRYEVETVFDPGVISQWCLIGEEDAVLRDETGIELAVVHTGDIVTVMGYHADSALVTWDGIRGYLPCTRLFPVSY